MFMNTDGSVDSTVEINDGTTNGPSLGNSDKFGRSITNIGDLNNDGVNDIAVGVGDAIHIMFMNIDATIDSTVEINSGTTNGPTLVNSDRFGDSTTNIGDLNNDGVNDIAVGAAYDDNGGADRGAIHLVHLNVNLTAPTAAITYSTRGPYKPSNPITIIATFSEAVEDSPVPLIEISGENTLSAIEMTKTSSTVYTYSHTVKSGSGTATVAISAAQDAARNVVVSTPTSGSTFTILAINNDVPFPPHLHDEVSISINSDVVYDLKIHDDVISNILAHVGDTISVTVSVGDDTFLDQISKATLITNYDHRPSDMNQYYSTNHDEMGKTGLSVYEWNQNTFDQNYDYAGVISWDETIVKIDQRIETYHEFVGPLLFDENELFVTYSMTFNDVMPKSQVGITISDTNYNNFECGIL